MLVAGVEVVVVLVVAITLYIDVGVVILVEFEVVSFHRNRIGACVGVRVGVGLENGVYIVARAGV